MLTIWFPLLSLETVNTKIVSTKNENEKRIITGKRKDS